MHDWGASLLRITSKEIASEEDSKEEGREEEEGSGDEKMENEKLPGLDDSPPSCLRKDWMEQAMKRPAAGSSTMKKPSASESHMEKALEKGALKKSAKKFPQKATGKLLLALQRGLEQALRKRSLTKIQYPLAAGRARATCSASMALARTEGS